MASSLPPLPRSWSELSWQQLCDCWRVKIRYGGNADVARVAALLSLLQLSSLNTSIAARKACEPICHLRRNDGTLWVTTPRELSQMALQALPWFDYPYGDPGEPVVKDKKGKVVKEARDPVRGYVGPLRDALALPEETVTVGRWHFALPQVACTSLTWQQYRSLQTIAPQLFAEGVSEDDALDLQAQFMAHCLVPRSHAILDTDGGTIRLRPHYEYRYNKERADGLVSFWRHQLSSTRSPLSYLFHICFQVWQTALLYYAEAYPMLFNGESKADPMRDALQGEVGTINAVMMKAHYTSQQEVYDSNLPFILDILNTMTKEAKEIEKMNAKIRKK